METNPRMKIKREQYDSVLPDELTPNPERWWHIEPSQLFTVIISIVSAIAVVAASWFTLRAEVTMQFRDLDLLKQRTVAIEKAQGETAVAVAKVETKLDAVATQIDDLKHSVERIADSVDRGNDRAERDRSTTRGHQR